MLTSSDINGSLLSKIEDYTAMAGVVGMGYVGLPFAVEKAKMGFPVVGIEGNPKHVEKMNRAKNYIPDVADQDLLDAVANGLLKTTSDFAVVSELDVIVIAAPTPLTKNLNPDLQFVEKVTTHRERVPLL